MEHETNRELENFMVLGTLVVTMQKDGSYGMLFNSSRDYSDLDAVARASLVNGVLQLFSTMAESLAEDVKKETN
jgi:N-acetylglucosamine-6-phosphate deacetylase